MKRAPFVTAITSWIIAICAALATGAQPQAWAAAASSQAEPVTPPPSNGVAARPSAPAALGAPPHTWVVFGQMTRANDSFPWNGEVFISRGDEPPARLTTNGISDGQPRLNHDATRIVFISDRDGNYNIFTMGVDGGNVVRLTSSPAGDTQPYWSPDGSRVVFSSTRNGHSDIYVVDANGANETRLTTDAGEDYEPAWSPDGAQIAFVSTRAAPGSGTHIWLMNADGTSQRVAESADSGRNPVWSLDGQNIIFVGIMSGDGDRIADLLSVSRDGGAEAVLLPSGFFEYYEPMPCDVLPGKIVFYIAYELRFLLEPGYYVSTGVSDISCPDYQAQDLTPPTTSVNPLPAISPADIVVSWSGSANDGPAVEFTYEVQWRDNSDGQWHTLVNAPHTAAPQATFRGAGGHSYAFRCRGVDVTGNVEGWPLDAEASTTVESQPPVSAMAPLPELSRPGAIALGWSGSDVGDSGLAHFDVEYRIGPSGAWTRLLTRTMAVTTTVIGVAGAAYDFRVRATDLAGNIEDWPAGDGDIHTQIELSRFLGRVLGADGVPVSGAAFQMASPVVFTAAPSAVDGAYAVVVVTGGLSLSFTVGKAGYGELPPIAFMSDRDNAIDLFLPPGDNVVTDGHFEAPTIAGEWMPLGTALIDAAAAGRHTGARGLALGGMLVGQPSNVSRSSTESTSPALVLDLDGLPHVVWIERAGDFAEVRYARQAVSGTWSSPIVLLGNALPAAAPFPAEYRPELARDALGQIHVLWRTWPNGNVFYAIRATEGAWQLYQIAVGLDDDSLPRLAVDWAGNATMAWHDGNGVRRDIFTTRRSTDGQWAAIENLTSGEPYLTNARDPAIAVDLTGTVSLVWDNGTGFLASRPITGGWTAPTGVFLWPFELSKPQLEVDANGMAHVAWQATKTGMPAAIAYARFRASRILTPIVVEADSASLALKRLVVDIDGRAYLAWTRGNSEFVLAAQGENGAWTTTRITTSTGLQTTGVDLVAAATGVWAVWNAGDPGHAYAVGCGKWTSSLVWEVRGQCGAGWQGALALAASDDQLDLVYLPQTDAARDVWHLSWPDAPVGPSRISQRLTLPLTLTSPGLSFLYRIDGSSADAQAAFTVTAETELGATAVFTSLETPGTPWQHVWRDVGAFAGQSITLSFAIDPRDGSGGARLALDEVTLGSTAPDLWVDSALPPEIRPATAQTMTLQYGNRGGGFAAGAVITLTLPPGLSFDSAEPPPLSAAPELVWQPSAIPPGTFGPSIVLTLSISPGSAGATLTPSIVIDSTTPELELANNAWRAAVFAGYRAHLPLIRAP